MKNNETPRPWTWIPSIDENHRPTITKKKGRGVIAHILSEDLNQADADAQLICKAVNAYDELKAKADKLDVANKRVCHYLTHLKDTYTGRDLTDYETVEYLLTKIKELTE